MAFSSNITESGSLGNGLYYEKGTWNGSAVTTGNITMGTPAGTGTSQASTTLPKITKIISFFPGNDNSNATTLKDVANSTSAKTLTFTSGDTGTYVATGTVA
jgi:hypothetical protein